MQQRATPHEKFREARINADLSQQALAKLLGISQPLVSRIEAADRVPGARVRLKIQAFAGIPFEAWP